MNGPQRVSVDGLEIDNLDQGEAIRRIFGMVGSGGLVVTPNLDHLSRYHNDPLMRELYNEAALRLADGAPVVALARLAGDQLARVTGADLFPLVCAEAARRRTRIAVVGMPDDAAAQELNAQLRSHFPGIEAITISPPYGFERKAEDLEKLTAELRNFGPEIIFACLGSPKQELWARSAAQQFPGAVFIGAGASALFFTGHLRRAPKWLRRLGFEWMHRLAMEPRRLTRRYSSNASFLVGAAFRQIRLRFVR